MAKKHKSFFGVCKGRVPGVYDNWEDCKAQVERCANQYRGFETYDEAAIYVATGKTRDELNGNALFDEWKRTQKPRPSARNDSSSSSRGDARPQIKVEAFDASQSYFSQVPNFQPDDKADFEEEFGRFASSQNIVPGTVAWRQKRTATIRHEMVFHYSQKIESDDEDDSEEDEEQRKLRTFRNMCREAKLEPLDTIDGCVANLKSVLINIPDYINAKRNGRPIKVWPPHKFEEFRKYTLSADKRIDLRTAREGDGLLAALLQVLRPTHAADVYRSRRNHAAKVREECASRAPGNPVDQICERWLTPIKEEAGTPPGGECDVVPIYDTDSDPGCDGMDPDCDETDFDSDCDVRGSGSNCDVMDSNSDGSSSPQSIKDETVDTTVDIPPWSPSSIGSSVVEVLLNTQTGTKRDLSDLMEGQDNSEDEVVIVDVRKRARI